jgi:hypothetical protein
MAKDALITEDTSSVTKKKSVNQKEMKAPVKIWIAARKKR